MCADRLGFGANITLCDSKTFVALRLSLISSRMFLLATAILLVSCKAGNEPRSSRPVWSEPRTIRVAAIQMEAELGEVEANLERSERLVRDAFERGAEWVVLPELFSSAIAFHPKLLDAVRPLEGEPLRLLVGLAQEYDGVVGGSFLAWHGEESYNTFALAFPDGSVTFHNKDEPTLWENCYYKGGDDDGVLRTPVGPVGAMLCAEMFRSRTVRRMADRVGLVLAASSWWTVPDGAPEVGQEWGRANRKLLGNAPQRIAHMLGVPVVHASQAGRFEGYLMPSETVPYRSHYMGETQIVDATGRVLVKMATEDGEGVIVADIEVGVAWEPGEPIPEGHWIQPLPEWFDEKWKREALFGEQYYRETTLPHVRRQLASEGGASE